MNIGVVIVTYQRYELLSKVVESVLDQSYSIGKLFIIDNSPHAEFMVTDSRITYLPQSLNIGGAGGFSIGIKEALLSGFDLIWTLDDDAIPEHDALEKLVASYKVLLRNEKVAFVCSRVLWADTDEWAAMNLPKISGNSIDRYASDLPVVRIKHCSFVSCLISADAIRQEGLPIADFFIWFDDVEYTTRLASYGHGYLVLHSIVRHYMPENIGADYSLVNQYNSYKFIFGARNEGYYRFRNQGVRSWLKFSARVFREMARGDVDFKLRIQITQSLFKALLFNPEIEKIYY